MNSVEVISVIVTTSREGSMTDADPVRIVTQYWTMQGELLFTVDPWLEQENDRRQREEWDHKKHLDTACNRNESGGTR